MKRETRFPHHTNQPTTFWQVVFVLALSLQYVCIPFPQEPSTGAVELSMQWDGAPPADPSHQAHALFSKQGSSSFTEEQVDCEIEAETADAITRHRKRDMLKRPCAIFGTTMREIYYAFEFKRQQLSGELSADCIFCSIAATFFSRCKALEPCKRPTWLHITAMRSNSAALMLCQQTRNPQRKRK